MNGAAQAGPSAALRGATVIHEMKKAGVRHVLSVPDLHTSRGLLWPIANDPQFNLIRVCKEDECFGIAAGLTYGDQRAAILIQYTGFLYAMNAIRGVALEQKLPICMMIGLLGKEPGVDPRESRRFGVRIVQPILDAIGIPHAVIETDDDAPAVVAHVRRGLERFTPAGDSHWRTSGGPMINRKEALSLLARRIDREIVVATYSSATDWLDLSERPLNYFSSGAMGLASSHGLGLAIARPERRVIVLDGDGSLLMNLGTLVTIGRAAPVNFTHLVFQNGSYEANGGHPVPNPQADFETIARGAGLAKAFTVRDLASFEAKLDVMLNEPGPVFGCVVVEQGPLGPRSYKDMYKAERRHAMRSALGCSPLVP